ncbi:MAG: hypothetical protein IKR52_00450 [Paludibacteraceae bacterium]|nr:hypothetical protein [Paludibacteraceae bacterium]
MKTNKRFFAMLAFCATLAAFSFSSCSDDDDDKKKDEQEQTDGGEDQTADFVKTYGKGKLNVNFSGNDYPSLQFVDVAEDTKNAGKYTLSIQNFSFLGIEVGNIDVNSLTATTDAEGNTTLTADGESDGPEVDMSSVFGFIVKTKVSINSCYITKDGVLTLNVLVKLYDKETEEYAGEEMDVVVTYDSSITSLDDDTDDADFVKTYGKGKLNVNFSGNDYPSLEFVDVTNDTQNAGKYALSIKNFAFMGIEVGNIDVNNLTATTDAEGNTTLTADGESDGPEVDMSTVFGFIVKTKVSINSCYITKDGVLTLNVLVKLYDKESDEYAGEDMDVVVTYDSSITEI